MDAEVVIDASVWVSRLVQQDTNHNASRLWVNRYIAAGGLLVAPALLAIEVAASISRQTGELTLAKAEAKNLYSIPSIRLMSLDSGLVWAAVDVAADPQLRTGDATYVAVAHQLNIPLVSWDKEQLQRARSLTVTYTPDSYVF